MSGEEFVEMRIRVPKALHDRLVERSNTENVDPHELVERLLKIDLDIVEILEEAEGK